MAVMTLKRTLAQALLFTALMFAVIVGMSANASDSSDGSKVPRDAIGSDIVTCMALHCRPEWQPKPDPTRPDLTRPAPVKPLPVATGVVQPQPIKPAPVKPQPVKPAPVKPQPVKPAPVKPQPVKPQPVKPAPPKLEPAKPVTPLKPQPVAKK
jgi:outer membrane biosynthesis protein TonB